MRRQLFRFFAILAILLLNDALLANAGQRDPVFVNQVRFAKEKLHQAAGLGHWLEVEVEIEGGPNPDPNAFNRRFVDNVRVFLGLGFSLESRPRLEKAFRFFRAEARLPTIEEGDRKSIFFYLPSEIVERDQLREKPFAYLVELSVGGQPLATRRGNTSSNLENARQVAHFRQRLETQAIKNDGILLPIYHTPFQRDSRKSQVSPAFVHKGAGQQ